MNEQRQKMREAGKPLGVKNYGSIPHLPGSRVGPGDHYCNPGHAEIAHCPRRGDTVFVTEKLDGSNCGVARVNGELVALTRSGYRAELSEHETHRLFARWLQVNEYRFETLKEGERIVGEWMAHAVGTRYNWREGDEPFVLLDYFDANNKRRSFYRTLDLQHFTKGLVAAPTIVVYGHGWTHSFEDILSALGESGRCNAELAEGLVLRVETDKEFNFMAKYVRSGKEDGKYLDGPLVWNVDKSAFMRSIGGER